MNTRLSGLENTTDYGSVKPYSAFVRLLKLVLPIFAIGIVLLLVLWPQLTAIKTEPLGKADIKALQEAKTENRLLKPVFNTQDDKNRPITITADEAIQVRTKKHIVELIKPSATLKEDDGAMVLNADHGQYDQSKKIISLQNNVSVTNEDGTILETQSLTMDIANGTAQSHAPAKLTLPNGVIEGQKIRIENNGQKTIFEGPAKAILTPTSSKGQ